MNAVASMAFRVLNPVPSPLVEEKDAIQLWRRFLILLSRSPRLSDPPSFPVLEDQWLKSRTKVQRCRLPPSLQDQDLCLVKRQLAIDFTIKVEPLPNLAGRNISPVPASTQWMLGPLVLLLSLRLKGLPFYMGGLNLRQRCSNLERFLGLRLISVDQSKYDRHLWLVRPCLRLLGSYLLPLELQGRWKRGLKRIERAALSHMEGFLVMDCDEQLWSGEPATSLFGSIFNVFLTWLGGGLCSRFFEEGGGVDRVVCSGDDKIDDVPFDAAQSVCEALGLEVTLEGLGTICDVPFLGRYHFLRAGRLWSCAQFTRAVTKFHCSASKGDRLELLCSKASCLLCTDYSTPVLGAIAYYIVVTFGPGQLTENARLIADLGVMEFVAMGPPVFCEEAAACIAFHEHWSIQELRNYHRLALRGQFPCDWPIPVPANLAHYIYL
jgi:hypothetical protein